MFCFISTGLHSVIMRNLRAKQFRLALVTVMRKFTLESDILYLNGSCFIAT